jgi:hypothetical protein
MKILLPKWSIQRQEIQVMSSFFEYNNGVFLKNFHKSLYMENGQFVQVVSG